MRRMRRDQVIAMSAAMLRWRMRHMEHTLTHMRVENTLEGVTVGQTLHGTAVGAARL